MKKNADWKTAARDYADKWLRRGDVSGVLVCGSYVSGKPSKRSDIDVCVVLRKAAGWRARGDERCDGYLFEYFANPAERVRRYFKEEFSGGEKCTAHMYASGLLMGDKDGELAALRREAARWLKKKFKKPSRNFVELAKYQLWDMADNLEGLCEEGSRDLPYHFHGSLASMFRLYSRFLGYGGMPQDKVLKILRGSNGTEPFPDRAFAGLYLKAAAAKDAKAMMSAYRRLTRRVLARMGGFNIDGWRLKSAV